MIDSEIAYQQTNSPSRPDLGEIDDVSESGVSECICHVCLKSKERGVRRKVSRFSSYDEIVPETTKFLTDHQYFLCSPWVYAYVFKSRSWGKSPSIDDLPLDRDSL